MKSKKLSSIAFVLMTICITAHASAKAEEAATIENEELEAGRKLYMKKCEVCHLIGRNLINPEKEILNSKLIDDPDKLKEFLSHKNGVMPAFAKISRDDKLLGKLNTFLKFARSNPSKVNKQTPSGKETKKEVKKEVKKENKQP